MAPEAPSDKRKEDSFTAVEISYELLPEAVRKLLIELVFLGDHITLWNNAQFVRIEHQNGDTSFGFSGVTPSGRTKGIVGGVVEIRGETPIGYARFTLHGEATKEHLIQKPRVTYSETFQGYKGQGLHRRRLEIMNMLSMRASNLPLHSDVYRDRQPAASSAWKHLERDGKALRYDEGPLSEPGMRFRFKTPDEA